MVAVAAQKAKRKAAKKRSDSDDLRAMLVHSGLTQAEFAHRIGMAERTVRRYMSGTHNVPKVVMMSARIIMGGS